MDPGVGSRLRSESGSTSAASSSSSSSSLPSILTRNVGIWPVSKSNAFSSSGRSEFCHGWSFAVLETNIRRVL